MKFVSFTHRYTRVLGFGFQTPQKQHKSLVEMLIKTPELDNMVIVSMHTEEEEEEEEKEKP